MIVIVATVVLAILLFIAAGIDRLIERGLKRSRRKRRPR